MKRNYGIDFLRILSMFMIVVLHVLGQGGILDNAEINSTHYWVAWAIEIACYCAVNCFALISGYVMYQSRPKFSRMLELWLQTLFYTIVIAGIFFVISPDQFSLKIVIDSVFPITRNHYWYISSYFGLLIFVPMLNVVMEHTDKRTITYVLTSIFVLLCFLPLLLMTDPYSLSSGYSLIWLSILYLTGAYLHKYKIADSIANKWLYFTLFGAFLLTLLSKFVIGWLTLRIFSARTFDDLLISYVSPTIVVIGICLLLLCSKLTIKPVFVKVIQLAAPATLGVYLIHVNHVVWNHWIADFAVSFLNHNVFVMVLLILLAALTIYVVCTAIELLRQKLFVLLRVHKLCSLLETRFTLLINPSNKKA